MSIKTNIKEAPVTVFWDSGATISLIAFTAVEALGLNGNKMQMTLKSYLVPLIDVEGKIFEFKVYGID